MASDRAAPVRSREPASFAARLLGWYDRERRDLPWRRSSDPWAIWVSEVMLQQTRVEAVLDAYDRFLSRYPSPRALARASDDELLAAWRGLGYYRRARLLRDGARAVLERHDGEVPDDPDALGALPGVGSYTRGAIASIAFRRLELAIDGNVERVTARHRGIDGVVKRQPAAGQVRDAVRGWIDADRPGDFNQAMMELGAIVCRPTSPACASCPIARDCVAVRDGRQAELPRLPPRRETVEVTARAALIRLADGRVLGRRVPPGEVNAGQLDLPGPGPLVGLETGGELACFLADSHRVPVELGAVVATVRHGITHHRITVHVHLARRLQRRGSGNLVAHAPDDDAMPWTTIARKAFTRARLFLARSQ